MAGAAALALISTSALCLTGCLESDVLVNYVLDQENGETDYDNPEKQYVPDPDATTTLDDLAKQMNKQTEKLDEVVKDLAINTDETTTDKTAKSATYSEVGESLSTAAQQVTGDGDESDGKGKGESKKKDTSKQGKKNADVDSSNNVYDGSFGETEDLPEDIKTVCAVNNAATITMSIGGEGTLVGTSAEYKSNKSITKVFSNRGISKASVCWSKDGNSKDANIKAIIKASPDAVLVTSGEETITVEQERKLGDAGIRVIVLPAMTSDTNIRSAVKAVGKLFNQATDGESSERASSYISMVKDTLKAAEDAHGGGIATYQRRNYDDANNLLKKTSEDTMSEPNWSLFITDWDSNAIVSATYSGETVFKNVKGVAATMTGWSWSPVSYYMSCGGTINNAAAYGDLVREPDLRLVSQYSDKTLDFSWTKKPEGVSFLSGGGSISDTDGAALLTNGYDAYETKGGNAHPLGSSDFNKVFVSSKSVKTGLEKAQSSTFYKPVKWVTFSDCSGYGIDLDGKLVPAYSVAKDSERGDTGYDIIVNPCGMVGNWYKGSMESYLESLWIASQYYSNKISENDVKDAVEAFYRDYYGYNLSSEEKNKIVDGDYAE